MACARALIAPTRCPNTYKHGFPPGIQEQPGPIRKNRKKKRSEVRKDMSQRQPVATSGVAPTTADRPPRRRTTNVVSTCLPTHLFTPAPDDQHLRRRSPASRSTPLTEPSQPADPRAPNPTHVASGVRLLVGMRRKKVPDGAPPGLPFPPN